MVKPSFFKVVDKNPIVAHYSNFIKFFSCYKNDRFYFFKKICNGYIRLWQYLFQGQLVNIFQKSKSFFPFIKNDRFLLFSKKKICNGTNQTHQKTPKTIHLVCAISLQRYKNCHNQYVVESISINSFQWINTYHVSSFINDPFCFFFIFSKKSVMTDLKNFCPTLVCGTSYNVSMFLHSYTHILNHFRLRKCCAWYIIFNGIKMDVINQPMLSSSSSSLSSTPTYDLTDFFYKRKFCARFIISIGQSDQTLCNWD